MFPTPNRLPRSSFFTKGKSLSSPTLLLIHFPNELSYNRYAVVISKKIDKRAVTRNHIRRSLTHLLQQIDPTLPQSMDLKLIVKKKTDIPVFLEELTSLLSSL